MNLSQTMKENEQASSYRLTMDRGVYHKQSVEGSVSMIFYSSLLLRAWWFGGGIEESNYTQLRSTLG